MHTARVAICAKTGALSEAIALALHHVGDTVIVHRSDAVGSLVAACEQLCPDYVVLDERLAEGDPERVLREAGMGMALPAVLVCDEVAEGDRRPAGISHLARSILMRDDELARAHVRARFAFVSTRGSAERPRLTLSADAVSQAMREVQERARTARMRPEVARLTARPLELILLVGQPDSLRPVVDAVKRITDVQVPVLISVEESHAAVTGAVGSLSQFPVQTLEASTPLRTSYGLIVVPSGRAVAVAGGVLRVDSEPGGAGSQRALVASMGELGASGLTVVLSDERSGTLMGLRSVVADGGLVASLDPKLASEPAVARQALDSGLAGIALSIEELAWLIGRAIPRRG